MEETLPAIEFHPAPCPDCGEPTSMTNLGGEKPREICGRFGCDWDGVTLLAVATYIGAKGND